MIIKELTITGLENLKTGLKICYTKPGKERQVKSNPLQIGAQHTTVLRFCHVTIHLSGISSRAANQIRTHRSLQCLTTSTQYVDHSEVGFQLEYNMNSLIVKELKRTRDLYAILVKESKDLAASLLPQCIRRDIRFTCDLHALYYVMRTRMSHGNIDEIKDIFDCILHALPEELQHGYEYYKKCDYIM